MRRSNGLIIIAALFCVSLVHAGAYVSLTAVADKSISLIDVGDASILTLHQFQLEGVSDAVDGNAEDSAEVGEDVPASERIEIIEELVIEKSIIEESVTEESIVEEPQVEEPVIESEVIVEPEPIVEPVIEPESIKEPEPVVEAPVEKVVTTESPSEQKVIQPKAPVEKPKPQSKPRTESKPKPKPKSGAESQRVVQQAKAVYSETEVNVLNKPLPSYPRAALQRRMQGVVQVLIHVNAQGIPQSVNITRSSGHRLLDSAAEKAAMKVRLKPVKINGVATPINVTISYQFKL